MAGLKFEIRSLPQLVRRSGRVWFKLTFDHQLKWKPDSWQEPVDETEIQSVLQDAALTTYEQRRDKLMQLTGRDAWHCGEALRNKKWSNRQNSYLSASESDFANQMNEPARCGTQFWFYRNRLVKVMGERIADELPLFVKHKVLAHEKSLERARREVEAFENLETLDRTSREPIPERVRLFVWQRDKGRCAKCGSRQRLEYDHIIPLANGGGNTERNIQLLCESCNRSKGSTV